MGRYLETLKHFEVRESFSKRSPQTHAVGVVPVTPNNSVHSDLEPCLLVLATAPTKESEYHSSPGSTPATPNSSVPNGYCPECGGGYWIREIPEATYQCGRCTPIEPYCESVYVPGGTPLLTSPIEAGSLVVYLDQTGRLCGGVDDRMHGTVEACQREAGKWIVVLTDGQRLPLSKIRAMASTHPDGRISAAWSVREHGFDGMNSK